MNHKVHRFKTPDYRDSRLQTTRIQTQKVLESNSWHEEGITRVIVTICILNIRIAMCRILPCLRQQTIVPVYVVPAEKKLSTKISSLDEGSRVNVPSYAIIQQFQHLDMMP
jgi:hypothetical protein